jgi:hypothetical protein
MASAYIEQYQRVLKERGRLEGARWVFHCPFPACAGEMDLKFYVNPELGGWTCWRCNQAVDGKDYSQKKVNHGGGWKDFVKMVGDEENIDLWPKGKVEYDRPKPPILTKGQRRKVWGMMFALGSLRPEDHTIIEQRGINPLRLGAVSSTTELWDKMLATFGEELCLRGGIAYEDEKGAIKPTRCVHPGRILIPYWDENEEVYYFVGYVRCREQRPTESNTSYEFIHSRHVKYAGPTHYDTQVYGRVPRDAEFIIITEGQLKAEAAIQRGYACVGLQGMGSKHVTIARECAMRGVQRAFIVFDTQVSNQELVDHEGAALARELLKVGVHAYRVVLPLEDGEGKADLDSYLVHHDTDEFNQLLLESTRYLYRLESQAKGDPCPSLRDSPDSLPASSPSARLPDSSPVRSIPTATSTGASVWSVPTSSTRTPAPASSSCI